MDSSPDINKTNSTAVIAFVLAFFLPPAGIIFGLSALRQIRSTPQRGRGLAMAAIWVGVVVFVAGGIYIFLTRGLT